MMLARIRSSRIPAHRSSDSKGVQFWWISSPRAQVQRERVWPHCTLDIEKSVLASSLRQAGRLAASPVYLRIITATVGKVAGRQRQQEDGNHQEVVHESPVNELFRSCKVSNVA